jgi:hypothetical protein
MIKVFFVRINLSKRREKKKITTMQASPPANVVYNVSSLCCRCTTASEEAAIEISTVIMDSRSIAMAIDTVFRLRCNFSRTPNRRPSWGIGRDGTIANMMDAMAK